MANRKLEQESVPLSDSWLLRFVSYTSLRPVSAAAPIGPGRSLALRSTVVGTILSVLPGSGHVLFIYIICYCRALVHPVLLAGVGAGAFMSPSVQNPCVCRSRSRCLWTVREGMAWRSPGTNPCRQRLLGRRIRMQMVKCGVGLAVLLILCGAER